MSVKQQPDDAVAVPTWTLALTELSGDGLVGADFSGKSDPYVVFLGDCLIEAAHTEWVHQTLTPVWEAGKLPALRVFARTREELATDHILLAVMDYDAVRGTAATPPPSQCSAL